MSGLSYFINQAIAFVMPDQLYQLAHTCKFACGLVLPRCKTIARMSDSPYASQVTVVRAFRYSSLTCLMYNDKKRTELIHFISANLEFAFGFACHNDDLELAKYIDGMYMNHQVPSNWSNVPIMYAVPHYDLERTKSLIYNELRNCTHSYRIFARLYDHKFKNIPPIIHNYAMHFAVWSELDVAVYSGYIKLVRLVTNNLCQIQSQDNTLLTYESSYIPREIHDYLQMYPRYATYFDEIITHGPYHNAIDALRDESITFDWNYLIATFEVPLQHLFLLAIAQNRRDVAKTIYYNCLCDFDLNDLLVFYVLLLHLDDMRYIFGKIDLPLLALGTMTRYAFISLSTTKKLSLQRAPKRLHHVIDPCDEMRINTTDCSIIAHCCSRTRKTRMKMSLWSISNIINKTIMPGRMVNPAFSPNLRYIYADLLHTEVSSTTKKNNLMQARFIIGILLNDIDIVRESGFSRTAGRVGNYNFVTFVMSKQYARIYDSTSIIAFIGSSGLFRNLYRTIIIESTIDAISIIVRNMHCADLKEICDIVNQMKLKDSRNMMRYVLIECMVRATMKMRTREYMTQMDM